jgi:predicted transposase/invertase (TIGR01784 family)
MYFYTNMKAKYINPFTDFGFKKIFGEESSKPLLKDFLNALLPDENKIAVLSYKNPEHQGAHNEERKAIFDIYCENEKGERFIVEIQKAKQNYFKERTVYYCTFPIREQAEKGDWNYHLEAVYCIGVLDFTFNDYVSEAEKTEVIHTVQLKDQHGNTFYEKLTYIYLEMPNFKKAESELVTRLDKWLFFIQRLEDFQVIPAIFKDDIFIQAFDKAELAKLPAAEMNRYESSLKVYRDLKAVIDTARDKGERIGKEEGRMEGKEEGRMEAMLQVAGQLKQQGFSTDVIANTTGLSGEAIENL